LAVAVVDIEYVMLRERNESFTSKKTTDAQGQTDRHTHTHTHTRQLSRPITKWTATWLAATTCCNYLKREQAGG